MRDIKDLKLNPKQIIIASAIAKIDIDAKEIEYIDKVFKSGSKIDLENAKNLVKDIENNIDSLKKNSIKIKVILGLPYKYYVHQAHVWLNKLERENDARK